MKLITTREAAARLGVGTTTIKRWSDEGVLACVRTAGGHRRYREEDVATMLLDGQPTLQQLLPTLGPDAIDELDVGVVQLHDTGKVLLYNATEAHFSGLSPKDAVGRHFFGEVAPCTNNSLVYGRFVEGVRTGDLDVRYFYTFTYRLAPINVTLHLFRDTNTATNWLVVDGGRQTAQLLR